MRKLHFLIISVFLILSSLYLFIPNRLNVYNVVNVQMPEQVVAGLITYKNGWERWWPAGGTQLDSLRFSYQNSQYNIQKFTYNTARVTITDGTLKVNSTIDFAALSRNTAEIRWRFNYQTSYNPIRRYLEYHQSRKMDQNIKKILRHLKVFLADERNVYGIRIKYEKVQDTLVASIRTQSATYPSTDRIYTIINTLKQYTTASGINKTKDQMPMLNVTRLTDSNYVTTVALPVRRRTKGPTEITFNKLVPGNILMTEVHGGPAAIEKSMTLLRNYVRDQQHISPAIPFQRLLTNRLTETDTTKWITELYYPIL